MSNLQNEQWLEAAEETFSDALDDNNVGLAEAIIADTRDAGFTEQANRMKTQLREKTI